MIGPTRRALTLAGSAVALVALGAVSLTLALLLTPAVEVVAFGQTVQVGAVAPTGELGWSGPGQADLFGEGPVDTVQEFGGPIRPRIVWQSFNRDDAAGQFIQTDESGGRRSLRTQQVGEELAAGWVRFFARLVLVSAAIGGALYLVTLGLAGLAVRGAPSARHPRPSVGGLILAVCAAAAVTVGSALLTASTARDQLSGVATLADLTGTARLAPAPAPAGPARSDVDVVVLGDSTAAGVGNAALPSPTPQDTECGRSRDSAAEVVGSASGLRVLNLACSSATIRAGVLGTQGSSSGTPLPAQVGLLKAVTSVRAVIVSVGANDVGWSDFLSFCYALTRCDDQASERLFQSRLDAFRLQYAQLLQQLSDLPGRPTVLVTGYYDPFGDRFDCAALRDGEAPTPPPAGWGFAADPGADNQATKVRQKIDPLRSELVQLNTVLAQGAEAFGFVNVLPRFDVHALCSDQPWVQGLEAPFPFHPNAAGELAIAAAQLPHLAALLRR